MIGESPDLISVELATTPSEVRSARKFQAARYFEAGYIPALPDCGVIDDEWVSASTYHVARNADGVIVGVCRFVGSSEAGLPMLRHFELDPAWRRTLEASADTTYEMGALAADSASGHFAVAAALYRQTIRQFRTHPGQVHLLAALDARLFRAMRRFLHFPFQQVGDSRVYLGSETVPAYLYLPAALAEQVANSPRSARFFSGFETLDLVESEVIDLRSKYPELQPSAVLDLTSDASQRKESRLQ